LYEFVETADDFRDAVCSVPAILAPSANIMSYLFM